MKKEKIKMNEEKALSQIRKIKRNIKLAKALAIIIAAAELIFLPVNFAIRLVALLFIIFAVSMITLKIKAQAANIIFNDCDPQTYYAVCHGIYPEQSTAYFDAVTAYFMGDFQVAAELLSSLLKDKAVPAIRLDCLNMLAACAFLSGDFELCRETCETARAYVFGRKGKPEAKDFYCSRYDYFINFINGDYNGALKALDVCKNTNRSKQTNSYRFMMHYYTAAALYYGSRTQEAKVKFESIISSAPEFYICQKSKAYVRAIGNNVFLPVDSISLKPACEKGKQQPPQKQVNKKQLIISFAVLIIAVIIAVTAFMQIPATEEGTAYEVIGSDCGVSEICEMIELNDDCSLCIFTTAYDEIGVAYLKNQDNDKYTYCISYTAIPEIYFEEDDGYYITARGRAEKVYFDITDKQESIPQDSQVTPFGYNDKMLYFYIFRTEVKNNFADSCGVNFE